jgi:hypothetical protein
MIIVTGPNVTDAELDDIRERRKRSACARTRRAATTPSSAASATRRCFTKPCCSVDFYHHRADRDAAPRRRSLVQGRPERIELFVSMRRRVRQVGVGRIVANGTVHNVGDFAILGQGCPARIYVSYVRLAVNGRATALVLSRSSY